MAELVRKDYLIKIVIDMYTFLSHYPGLHCSFTCCLACLESLTYVNLIRLSMVFVNKRNIFFFLQQEEWDKHGEKLSHFIMTKANPPIFYLPAKLNDKTQKLLEESTRSVKSNFFSLCSFLHFKVVYVSTSVL